MGSAEESTSMCDLKEIQAFALWLEDFNMKRQVEKFFAMCIAKPRRPQAPFLLPALTMRL